MSRREGWLLLRRDGGLWAIRRSALRELRTLHNAPGANRSRIELVSGEILTADELLAMTPRLAEHPFPECARRYCDPSVHGLSVWNEQPVILLATGVPPPACFGGNQQLPVPSTQMGCCPETRSGAALGTQGDGRKTPEKDVHGDEI